ncbi:MAG: cysteine desulfurase family protein [Candidatus Paceibacterota bacterium]|jgi:cysteine desulfurase
MLKSTRKTNKSSKKIYLDYASSAFPNPSSIHLLGVAARKELENARQKVAEILYARPSEIIFTSGGTESNNLAIQGLVFFYKSEKNILPHIVTTNIEHPSVLLTCRMLEKRKLAQVSIVLVEADGIVDVKKIKKEIKKNTVLVSVMYANNEIGTIQPIREIAKEIRHYRKVNKIDHLFFHTDAVQAVNYLDLNVERLGVDLLSISGSKIEGAGRVGLLYKKNSVPLTNIWGGGNQEGGLRPGTENSAEILKFSKALQVAESLKTKEVSRLVKLQNYFLNKIQHSNILKNVGMTINGSLENRLPNNINITIPQITSDLLVIELSARGVYVSSKSACESGDGKASYVIKAINKNSKETDGSLRFSFGRNTEKGDIDYVIKSLEQILTKLKKWYY